MNLVKTYFRFIRVLIINEMEYKYSFIAKQFANLAWCATTFIGIWIIVFQFKTINGWDAGQIMFIYSINILSHSICGMFFWTPMLQLEGKVQMGELDLLLIKPISPFIYLIISNFVYTYFAWIAVSLFILIRSIGWSGMVISFSNILFVILTIIGGVMINTAIVIITGSLCFWIVRSSDILGLFHNSNRGIKPVADYPITIYPKIIQFIITFIVPYAFISYYPATHLFNKQNEILFGSDIQYMSVLVGAILLLISYFVWKFGLRRYNSTGS